MSTNTVLASAPLTTTGFHIKATGTTLGNSLIWDNGTNVGIGNTNTSYTLDVSGTGRFTGTLLVGGVATFSSSITTASAIVTSGATLSSWGSVITPALETINGNTISSYNSVGIPALYIASNAYHDGTNFVRKTANSAFLASIDGYNNSFQLQSTTSSTAGSSISWTSRFFVNGASGNVGICTSSPSKLLHLYNTAGTDVMLVESTQVFSTIAFKSSTNSSTVTLGIDGAGNAAFENKLTTGAMAFVTNGSERMRITSNGTVAFSGSADVNNAGLDKLSIGFYNSNYGWIQSFSSLALYLNKLGNAVYAGSVRLDTLSDARVKDNIHSIEGALNKVLSITGKKFHLKDEEEGKIRYGFIAQELEGILDEFVIQTNMTFKKDDLIVENVKSVDNWASSWSALLVEAIKEMNQQNQDLKSRLDKAGL